MNLYIYDKTFEGFLTLVFDAYAHKAFPDRILGDGDLLPLFGDTAFRVVTDTSKAQRVWKGLHKKISKQACGMLSVVFLSELPNNELLLFRYIQKAFAAPQSIEVNFADPDVLQCSKIYRKVGREAERMRMFVRFQKTADGIFFAPIEPKYNVLSLVSDFFTDRFGDQKWVIYDIKRNYGLYYDLHKTEEIVFDQLELDLQTGKLSDAQAAADEQLFQSLWKSYFGSITIKERLNPKLHRQLLPKRFWKFLPEKQ
ncbi:MAG: TIGR03915 family putative DNA repair protein [Bacteroidales bacterium]|nr:TIGR03915 family putative DNA repair protein [Bacteroidales bacterium]